MLRPLLRGRACSRTRAPGAAPALDAWIAEVEQAFEDRVLPVSSAVANLWAELTVPDPLPVIDGLLASTALLHDLTLVTRNIKDVARTGVKVLDPFEIVEK
jgi:predicted nucleic acid-binding protein